MNNDQSLKAAIGTTIYFKNFPILEWLQVYLIDFLFNFAMPHFSNLTWKSIFLFSYFNIPCFKLSWKKASKKLSDIRG